MDTSNEIRISTEKELPRGQVLSLYLSVDWSSARKPDALMSALANSHSVVSAWKGEHLIGLGNAISDGSLVVYYPHLVVAPEFQGIGVGRKIVAKLFEIYDGFHQHTLIADGDAISFYEKVGFERAGSCAAMWIYDGHDHD